eukprot:PhF_6_TR44497/c0_g1_i2/m.68533
MSFRSLCIVLVAIVMVCHAQSNGTTTTTTQCKAPSWLAFSQLAPFIGFTKVLPTMMGGDVYTCYKYDTQLNSVTFVMAIKNRGWAGFGVSKSGGMTNADISVFKKDVLGNNIVEDMFSKSNHYGPRKDKRQDVTLTGAYTSLVSETFVYVFTRNIRTCDPWDVSINTSGPTEFIAAFGRKLDYGLEFGEVRDIEGHPPGKHDSIKFDLFAGEAAVQIPSNAPGLNC